MLLFIENGLHFQRISRKQQLPSFLILRCVGAKCCPIDLSSDLDVLERSSSFKWSVSSSSLRQVTLPGATVTQLTWQVHHPSDKGTRWMMASFKSPKTTFNSYTELHTYLIVLLLHLVSTTTYLLYLVESVRKKSYGFFHIYHKKHSFLCHKNRSKKHYLTEIHALFLPSVQ